MQVLDRKLKRQSSNGLIHSKVIATHKTYNNVDFISSWNAKSHKQK